MYFVVLPYILLHVVQSIAPVCSNCREYLNQKDCNPIQCIWGNQCNSRSQCADFTEQTCNQAFLYIDDYCRVINSNCKQRGNCGKILPIDPQVMDITLCSGLQCDFDAISKKCIDVKVQEPVPCSKLEIINCPTGSTDVSICYADGEVCKEIEKTTQCSKYDSVTCPLISWCIFQDSICQKKLCSFYQEPSCLYIVGKDGVSVCNWNHGICEESQIYLQNEINCRDFGQYATWNQLKLQCQLCYRIILETLIIVILTMLI